MAYFHYSGRPPRVEVRHLVVKEINAGVSCLYIWKKVPREVLCIGVESFVVVSWFAFMENFI
jgi:hypothetical protein